MAGCAADTAGGAGADESNFTGSAKPEETTAGDQKAEIKTVKGEKKLGECPSTTSHLEVTLADSDVAKKINERLKPSLEESFDADCSDMTIDFRQEAAFNEQGILSVHTWLSWDHNMGSSASHTTSTFDLKTGDELQLTDIIDVPGQEKIDVNCQVGFRNVDVDTDISEYCTNMADGVPYTFTVQADGIHVYPTDLPDALKVFIESDSVTPWDELSDNILHDGVKAIAKK